MKKPAASPKSPNVRRADTKVAYYPTPAEPAAPDPFAIATTRSKR